MARRKQMWYDLNDAHPGARSPVIIETWTFDRDFMPESAFRCTEIVYSRKPDPNLLGVDVTLNEAAWSAHIRQTFEATHGVFFEFIIRDVYTVHGNLAKARRAVALARREIDQFYRS